MRSFTRLLAATAMAASTILVAAAASAGDAIEPDQFVKMYPRDKQGMVSKSDVMKAVDRMFDKHDKKKMGKLDQKQLEAFLQELMKGGG
jgi:hypothetical protein